MDTSTKESRKLAKKEIINDIIEEIKQGGTPDLRELLSTAHYYAKKYNEGKTEFHKIDGDFIIEKLLDTVEIKIKLV